MLELTALSDILGLIRKFHLVQILVLERITYTFHILPSFGAIQSISHVMCFIFENKYQNNVIYTCGGIEQDQMIGLYGLA